MNKEAIITAALTINDYPGPDDIHSMYSWRLQIEEEGELKEFTELCDMYLRLQTLKNAPFSERQAKALKVILDWFQNEHEKISQREIIF